MVTTLVDCALCGLPTAHPLLGEQGRPFCCPACREVAQLLGAPAIGSRQSAVATAAADSPLSTATATLHLGGLWCGSCAWLIGATLRRTPGVQAAEVSFAQREARVQYDPAATAPRRWLGRIRRAGYCAWLPGDTPYDEEGAFFTRLSICTVFAIHDVVLSLMIYGREWLGWARPEDAWLIQIFQAMMLLGAIPLIFLLGVPIVRAGLAGLLRGRPDMHSLIALGAFAAFGLSLRNLWLGIDRVYFDTTSMLLYLVAVGRWLELQAQRAGNQALERLASKLPHEAAWLTPEGERRVPPDQLPLGARVRVRPGERFPVDGLIASGTGDIDESLLSGEPAPVARGAGERALAGTISLDGSFEVLTTAVGANTTAGQIGRLLHQALWQRAPVERLADKLAALMMPAALLLAAGTFGFWAWQAGPEVGLLHALAVLLIACPCALGLATPLALWVALGRAAEGGALLRGTAAIERLAGVRQVFFDKTGTLTRQPFRLAALAGGPLGDDAFLARVAAIEDGASHPLAQAIVAEARARGLHLPAAEDVRALPGRGLVGRVAVGRKQSAVGSIPSDCFLPTADCFLLWVGNLHLMREQSLALPDDLAARAEEWRAEGLSVVYAGWDGAVRGLLGLGEDPRPEAAAAVRALEGLGLGVAVLTGDDAAAGERWHRRLGVPVLAELRPEQKLAHLRAAPGPAAMIGDGINDGPALAAAVGLALGQGSDVARAAADIILLNDDLRAAPWLVGLARAAMRRVRQNLAWAFVYNLVGLALAVLGLLHPALAAAAMLLSSTIVTWNALRLWHYPPLAGDAG